MTDRYGQIVSFYSFKGGVGRSMALANVAALLCKAGKSVLIVDWDLEAPGLHKFFESSSPHLKSDVESKPGVLDLLSEVEKGAGIHWQRAVIEVGLGDGSLNLISAGRRDPAYGSRLQKLRWDRLYEEFDIGQAFEDMREEWKKSYDFILLDSRTGVTDIGDVCTALLPDLLVTVFVANEQNVEGTKSVIERARTVHSQLPRDRTKLTVVPLLGRDESHTEYELSSSWRQRISAELGFTLTDWLPKELDAHTYFQKVFIPYYSYWSFGENLPVIQREQELSNPTSISSAYARVTSLIESGLDWTVLEKGVDSAEINSLRSRASEGEAKSAELEQKQREIETLAAQKQREIEMLSAQAEKLRSTSRTRVLAATAAALAMLLLAVGALYIYQFNAISEARLAETAARLQAAEASSHQAQSVRADLEAQRADLQKKITELQGQNLSLVDQLNKQNQATQQKLDEIITKQNQTGTASSGGVNR